MIEDQLQLELNDYYDYGEDNIVRYTHRSRINQINTIAYEISRSTSKDDKLKALDAGCGAGVYSILLAEMGYDVTAVNIDKGELKKAADWAEKRRVHDKIRFRSKDIREISCPDSEFNLIICTEVLEHLDNPIEGARELYRVLSKDGNAIISMPNMASLMGCLQLVYRKSGLRSLSGKPPLDEHQLQHSRFWFGNIIRMLKEVGFQIKYVCSTYQIPFLWHLDNILDRFIGENTTSYQIDYKLNKKPLFKYVGFNFIVVVTKKA